MRPGRSEYIKSLPGVEHPSEPGTLQSRLLVFCILHSTGVLSGEMNWWDTFTTAQNLPESRTHVTPESQSCATEDYEVHRSGQRAAER